MITNIKRFKFNSSLNTKFLILFILAIAPNFCFSQEPDSDNQKISMGVSLLGGISFSNFDNLNTRLTASEFRAFDSNPIYFNFGMHIGRKSGRYFSLQITMLTQNSQSPLYKEAALSKTGILFTANQSIWKTDNYILAPYLGLAMNVVSLSLTDNSGASQTFDQATQNLSNEKNLYTSPIINFDVGLNFYRKIFGVKKAVFGLVRGGYQYQFDEVSWGAGGYEVSNGPSLNTGGFYVEFGVATF